MTHNTTVTYKGITRIIDPADLTSAAAMLSFYDATIHQYTVAGVRRLTFHLTVTPGNERLAYGKVTHIAHQLKLGAYAEKTVVIEPPLRTTPRPGRWFHRGPHARPRFDVTLRSLTLTRLDPTGRPVGRPVVITESPTTEGAPVAEPTPVSKKALKRAKKLKKAKKGHPATGAQVMGEKVLSVVPATPIEVETVAAPAPPTTGKLTFYRDADGDHRWRLQGLNNRILAQAEGFTSLVRADGNVLSVKNALVNPVVVFDPESYPTKQ